MNSNSKVKKLFLCTLIKINLLQIVRRFARKLKKNRLYYLNGWKVEDKQSIFNYKLFFILHQKSLRISQKKFVIKDFYTKNFINTCAMLNN